MSRDIPHLSDVHLVSSGWINKYILTYKMPDGKLYKYESVSRKDEEAYRRALQAPQTQSTTGADAVCIVPQTKDDKLVLIKEFRYPLNSWCIAFPAGLLEVGESLETCVNRELREETGYILRKDVEGGALRPLPQASISSTGLSDESVHVVFAHVERAGDAQPESFEYIETFLLDICDVADFLDSNTIPIGARAQLILEGFAQHNSHYRRLIT